MIITVGAMVVCRYDHTRRPNTCVVQRADVVFPGCVHIPAGQLNSVNGPLYNKRSKEPISGILWFKRIGQDYTEIHFVAQHRLIRN